MTEQPIQVVPQTTPKIEVTFGAVPLVEITAPARPAVIEVLVQGPKGDPGSGTGGADTSYTHDQGTPAQVWTIDHGMGKRPVYVVFASDGSEEFPEATWPTLDRLVLDFGDPVSGIAHLS